MLSEKGKQALILREGKRNKAYLDTKGIPTIGVGHTGPEVKLGLVWTDQQVMGAFTKDIKWAEDTANSVNYPLSQNQFDALVSFIFNIGATAFNKSTMKRLLNSGDISKAAQEFDKWNIPKDIIPRRQGEKTQFLTKD